MPRVKKRTCEGIVKSSPLVSHRKCGTSKNASLVAGRFLGPDFPPEKKYRVCSNMVRTLGTKHGGEFEYTSVLSSADDVGRSTTPLADASGADDAARATGAAAVTNSDVTKNASDAKRAKTGANNDGEIEGGASLPSWDEVRPNIQLMSKDEIIGCLAKSWDVTGSGEHHHGLRQSVALAAAEKARAVEQERNK